MFACFVILLAISIAPVQEREIVRQSEEHFARESNCSKRATWKARARRTRPR